jgi:hypothetical protein
LKIRRVANFLQIKREQTQQHSFSQQKQQIQHKLQIKQSKQSRHLYNFLINLVKYL